MPGSSTSSSTDAEDYQTDLSDILAAFAVLAPGAFTARATRTRLRQLHLLNATENLPRVGYVAVRPDRAFISFSLDSAPSLVWGGLTLEPGEIVLHGREERLHQRTLGRCQWGMIALSASALAGLGVTETGRALEIPERGTILRPLPPDRKRLLRMHREAARLAETRPHILGHPEVVRAMGEELACALAACLTRSEPRPETDAMRCAAEIMVRFEALLTADPRRSLGVGEVCDRLGVAERRFRDVCKACLGATAQQYIRLRRPALRSLDSQPACAAALPGHAGCLNEARAHTAQRSAKS
nr:hypothetical protein [uncultured Rhodopila sp.]